MDHRLKLNANQGILEAAIKDFSALSRRNAKQEGSAPLATISAFCDLLERGGKRLRGNLVLHAFSSLSAQNNTAVVQAALAIEMIHAYLLIIDDIQDNSDQRRGGPAAHVLLAQKTDKHQGVALAINAALFGAHEAQRILCNLSVTYKQRVNILNKINEIMVVTSHGQTNDIVQQITATNADIIKTMQQKTAHYSFALPLQVGLIIANKDPENYPFIQKFALHIGVAFQLANDIEGLQQKGSANDLTEGKKTLLVNYALQHSTSKDRGFLINWLGNPKLTKDKEDKCRQIIVSSGALDYAKQNLAIEVEQAKAVVLGSNWPKSKRQNLCELADYVLHSA